MNGCFRLAVVVSLAGLGTVSSWAQEARDFTGYVEVGGAGAGGSVDVEWRFWRRVGVRMGVAYMPRFLLTGTTAVGPIVGMGVESADWGDCAQFGFGLTRFYETSDPLNTYRDRNDFLYASIGYRYLQMDGSLMLSLSLTPLFPLKREHGQWPIYPWLGASVGWRW
jgi:hypothetical protein